MVKFGLGRKNRKEASEASPAKESSSPAAPSGGYQPPSSPTNGSVDKTADEQGADKYAAGVLGASTTNGTDYGNDDEPKLGILSGFSSALAGFMASTDLDTDLEGDFTSMSEDGASHDEEGDGLLLSWKDGSVEHYQPKQQYAYCSLGLTGIHVLVLLMQLAFCGVAPLDVNPTVGPYPDAFSEWGGKNTYLIQRWVELSRFVTPAFLHVGLVHLLWNAVVQVTTCAFLEKEWGSIRWIAVYVLSEVGCITCSCVIDPDTIAVGSSGALMGIFGAKLAQVFSYTAFEVYTRPNEELIPLQRMAKVFLSVVVVSVLGFLNYIDWSGHWGGLATGFCSGMFMFSRKIQNVYIKIVWMVLGVLLTFGGLGVGMYWFFARVETDADLRTPCIYYRDLYMDEDYNCGCSWEP